jgi:dedicated sortase system histidine kinase
VYEERITGQWYERDNGYAVELRIPMEMLGDRLGFAVFDVDDPESRAISTVVATYRADDAERLGSLQLPTPEIDRIVDGMRHNNSRIQVVDRGGRVLLTVGDIQSATGLQLTPALDEGEVNKYWLYVQDQILDPLYYRILTKPSNDFFDELYSDVSREGTHIDSALQGQAITQFRTLADTQTRLLEAAHPILANGEVMGAVVVDQNMNGLRTFRNQALEQLFNTILAVMLLVTLGLFFFASRISNRIRGLRNQAEGIIDDTGRVQNTIVASKNSDEIGDLSRSFSNIVERLTQYTSYLENMSSRLSHELRTPVTVVRSSLENLSMQENIGESAVYLERAEEGISRLNLILTNMSEATRLEQMLQTSEKEKIDLSDVIHGCVEGYKLAYPDSRFELDVPNGSIHINGVPEYIAQLLDKLIANAAEFSYADQPITVYCRTLRDHAVIKVSNAGPFLPDEMKDRLFDSMISVRPQEKQKQPHLGMGLHIARIITDFHGGQIRAENRSDREGVIISVVMPLFYR